MSSKVFLNIFPEKAQKIKKEKPVGKVLVDYREKNCLVPSALLKLGAEIEFMNLKVGDYLVNGFAIERKTISDFIFSMINGRLVKQIEELKQYEDKLLIIEGIENQELYNDEEVRLSSEALKKVALPMDLKILRNSLPQFEERVREKQGVVSQVNSNSIRGFLISITLKHKIPVIYSKNSKDTAKFIFVLLKRKEKETRLNVRKKTLNKKEQLQIIIEGFPGIGPKAAKKLLEKFKTIKNIINASQEELKEVIGKKAEIFKLIEEHY